MNRQNNPAASRFSATS